MKNALAFDDLSTAIRRLPGDLSISRVEDSKNTLQENGAVKILFRKEVLTVELRQEISTTVVEYLAMRGGNGKRLVFGPYVNPVCAERLRKHGLQFVDQAGNAFLNVRGLYLFVSRDVPKVERSGKATKGSKRKFRESTLKLVYAFLTDTATEEASLLNQPYRRINEVCGVAVGSIGGVIEDLTAEGFVEEVVPGVRRLEKREQLLERWVQEYAQRLRPKLILEHYRPPRHDWAERMQKKACPGLWGGEVAGARLTGYLVPETATIYASRLDNAFIVENDLRKDPSGSVEVLCPFWPDGEHTSNKGCAHPLVVYADLMATEIDRNLETARRIYDKHLQALVTSD
jgi:hypothetical protein